MKETLLLDVLVAGILLIVAGALFCGFFLIFLAAVTEKKRTAGQPPTERTLSPIEFERACVALAEKMKLEVGEIHRSGDRQLDIFAENRTPLTGGAYIIHALLRGSEELVTAAEILELSNLVVQERASKGIFVTTGRFTEDLPTIGELAPIEFVDGTRLAGLVDYRVIRS